MGEETGVLISTPMKDRDAKKEELIYLSQASDLQPLRVRFDNLPLMLIFFPDLPKTDYSKGSRFNV